jgi:hypothetical protein
MPGQIPSNETRDIGSPSAKHLDSRSHRGIQHGIDMLLVSRPAIHAEGIHVNDVISTLI